MIVKRGTHNRAGRGANGQAFTLIEMLVVIGIIGIVAAITVPAIKNFQKSDAEAAATRQLLDDIARARQFAISQRSTVHMDFVPGNYWSFNAYDASGAPIVPNYTPAERTTISNLLPRQMIGYNFISLREIGSQPGQQNPKYLAEWRTLPEGMFIATSKFSPPASDAVVVYDPPVPQLPTLRTFTYHGFESNNVPFPTADSPTYFNLPCLTFNSTGQLVPNNPNRDEEIIPLARGKVSLPLDATKRPVFRIPTFEENPAGNSTNAFALIVVDRLTGRARVERQTPVP